MTELDHGRKDTIPQEVRDHIEQARDVLAEAFSDTIPLQRLRYTYPQIITAARLIKLVTEGSEQEEYHRPRGDKTRDMVGFAKGKPERAVLILHQNRENFLFEGYSETTKLFVPLHGIQKPETDYSAEELASRLLPYKPAKDHVRMLSHLPFMSGLRSITPPYRAFYLDPVIRDNLALYWLPDGRDSFTLSRIAITEDTPVPFDIWGVSQVIRDEEVAKAYERQKEKAPQGGVVFSPKPSFG